MAQNQPVSEARPKPELSSGASPLAPPAIGAAAPPHPMDGSQFHNVIEEQSWSELPPTPEEQMPRRARHLDDAGSANQPHPDQPQISVGPA